MNNKFFEFLHTHNIYDDEVYKYFLNHSVIFDYYNEDFNRSFIGCNYIKDKNENKNSACKNFYIIFDELGEDNIEIKNNKINEKYLKLKELLSRNENIVKELNKNEVIKLLNEYLNKER